MKRLLLILLLSFYASAQTSPNIAGDIRLNNLDYQMVSKIVVTLPSASTSEGRIYRVMDGQNSSDCTTGGGTTMAICISNGTTWLAVSGGLPVFTTINATVGYQLNGSPLALPANYGIDVTGPGIPAITPAKGNARLNLRATYNANSAILTLKASGSQSHFLAGRDEGKTLKVWDIELPLQPTPTTIAFATGAGCAGSAGTLGSATLDTFVYLTYEYTNGTSFSLPSFGQFIKIPAGNTNACITGTAPNDSMTGYVAGYSNVAVWAVKETVNTNLGTGGTSNWPGQADGTQYTTASRITFHSASNVVANGGAFQIDSMTGGAGSPANRTVPMVSRTIVSVQSASQVTLNSNIATHDSTCPNSVSCDTVDWYTDDTAAIQSAINYIYTVPTQEPNTRGATLFLPPAIGSNSDSTGAYYVCGLIVPSGDNLFHLMGAGAVGGFNLTFATGQNPAGSSMLVSDCTSPILTIGTNSEAAGNQMNAGPIIENLAFKDYSQGCTVPGAILLYAVSNARVQNIVGADFCSAAIDTLNDGATVQQGYLWRNDPACQTGPAGCNESSPPFNNFFTAISTDCLNCQNPYQAVNGKNSEFRYYDLHAIAPQFGGGIGLNHDGLLTAGANVNAGGNNACQNSSLAYYPVAYHWKDQQTGSYVQCRSESSSSNGFPGIIGGQGYGIGTVLDNTSGKNFENGVDVFGNTSGLTAWLGYIAPGSIGTYIAGPTATGGSQNWHDEGIATTLAQNISSSVVGTFGLPNTYVQVAMGATFTTGNLGCYATGNNRRIQDCTLARSPEWAGIITDPTVTGLSPTGGSAPGGYIQTSGVAFVNFNGNTVVTAGDHICVDTANAAKVVDNGSVLCLPGLEVGVARVASAGITNGEEIQLTRTGNGVSPGTVSGVTTSNMGAQSSASCTPVTGMSWPIAANKNYTLRCEIPRTLAASATIQYCIGGPGTANSFSLMADGALGAAGAWAQISTLAQTVYGTKTAASAAAANTTVDHVWAEIQNGTTASGTALTLQTAANGTNNITVLANASCTLTANN